MQKFVISTFYKFVTLEDFNDLKNPLLKVMQKHNILGTILLAREGINGTFSGTLENSEILYNFLKSDPRLNDLTFKTALHDKCPFEKAKVKLKKEIVTMGVADLNIKDNKGTYVTPNEWNEIINDPEVLIVDTRNDYEYEVGSFKNAINPNTYSFREFPDFVKTNLCDKKHKKIAMFCTGGIRCEKSTAYLKQLGFEKVYQLKGGILNYLDSVPKEKTLWQGNCFVFDDREEIQPYSE